jgi:hypothetical protein
MAEESMRKVSDRSAIPPKPTDDFHNIDDSELHRQLVLGAAPIASYVFGTPDKARSVYHLAAASRLPIFQFGTKLAIRKSVLRAYFWALERRAFRDQDEEQLVRLSMLLRTLNALIRTGKTGSVATDDTTLWIMLLTEASRAIDHVLGSE